LEKYRALYQENGDLVGWLSIEGTDIDYSVMQREDDEYYLHHDFYGEESRYGCLYVKGQADVDTPGTNFIIYGHNMKDGSMFGDLDLYRKESFWQEHPRISFDTLYEERIYEIIAVFRSRVYQPEEDVFKYYQFYQAENQEEFSWFYENIKELSLYDTGVTAAFGDTFLTLSTCAYHVEDGRFVVVAKAIAAGE
jgi:sortase B